MSGDLTDKDFLMTHDDLKRRLEDLLIYGDYSQDDRKTIEGARTALEAAEARMNSYGAMVEALAFYGEMDRYDYDNDCVWNGSGSLTKKRAKELIDPETSDGGVLSDGGNRARAALALIEGER